MKKLIVVMALLLGSMSIWAQEEKQPVEVNKLPNLALSNLKSYFPEVEVVEAFTVSKKVKDEYTVRLANSVEVVFDKHGQWKEVTANDGEIPQRMINGKMLMYLSQNKVTAKVSHMLKDKKGNYELTFDDGTVLNFDNQFKPMDKK